MSTKLIWSGMKGLDMSKLAHISWPKFVCNLMIHHLHALIMAYLEM